MKHVGKMKNNNAPVVIVFRTLPGEPNSCLVVGTQGLGPTHHDALIQCVESSEAQDAYELGTVLSSRRFPDNYVILPWLHQQGKLRKMPTSDVLVTPSPSQSIPLDELNKIIAEQKGTTVDKLAIGSEAGESVEIATVNETPTSTVSDVEEVDLGQTTTLSESLSAEEQAKAYRSQADKLAKQAAEMRRKAEELVPTKKKVTAKVAE